MGAGVYPLPSAARQDPAVYRGEAQFAGQAAALCECGSEDVWAVWRASEYDGEWAGGAWERHAGCGGWGGCGAGGEHAEAWAVVV